MTHEPETFIIEGTTRSGHRFRPSDWAERLCGVLSIFGEDQKLVYSMYVRPIARAGVKAVLVDQRLRGLDPDAYSYLRSFAADNELRVRALSPDERL